MIPFCAWLLENHSIVAIRNVEIRDLLEIV